MNKGKEYLLILGMFAFAPLNMVCYLYLIRNIKISKWVYIAWWVIHVLHWIIFAILQDYLVVFLGPLVSLLIMIGYYVVLAMMSML